MTSGNALSTASVWMNRLVPTMLGGRIATVRPFSDFFAHRNGEIPFLPRVGSSSARTRLFQHDLYHFVPLVQHDRFQHEYFLNIVRCTGLLSWRGKNVSCSLDSSLKNSMDRFWFMILCFDFLNSCCIILALTSLGTVGQISFALSLNSFQSCEQQSKFSIRSILLHKKLHFQNLWSICRHNKGFGEILSTEPFFYLRWVAFLDIICWNEMIFHLTPMDMYTIPFLYSCIWVG